MPAKRPLLLCLALLGCTESKPQDSGRRVSNVPVDDDGDGSPYGQDCDDTNEAVYPGADEICDGLDNDCDGGIDEDMLAEYWPDVDGDGFGDAATSVEDCLRPAGYVPNADDCDDDNAQVYPGCPESCDGIDNDCDDEVDEGALLTFYRDADEDGFGDEDNAVQACEAPKGYIERGRDCDDQQYLVNPTQNESCDGIDNDCDGEVDEDDAVDAPTWYIDMDRDGYGSDLATREACQQPSDMTDNDDDCDDHDAAVNPGASEVPDEIDNDCDGMIDEFDLSGAHATLIGEVAGDRAGYAVSAAGDVDGDRISDLLVGAPGNDFTGGDAGAAYLVRGPPEGNLDLGAVAEVLLGEAAGDQAGHSVAGGQDVDGDGMDDLLVGAPYYDAGGGNEGAAYLVLGAAPITWSAYLPLGMADARLLGEWPSDYAGYAVAMAGDVEGDGYADLLVGAPFQYAQASYGGAAYLLRGPVSGELGLEESDAKLMGESYGDGLGVSVAEAGDTNGDGYAELLAGANCEDAGGGDAGAAYLAFGPLSGVASAASVSLKLLGENSYDYAGFSVAGAGDVNADGYADVLVGAPYEDSGGSAGGAAYLLLGAPLLHRTSSLDLSAADAKLYGSTGESAGQAVAGAGDADGDGLDDVLVGAPFYQYTSQSGAAYLACAPMRGVNALADSWRQLPGVDAGDYAGYALSSAGDHDSDGRSDLLVGVIYEDTADTDAGAACLVLVGGL